MAGGVRGRVLACLVLAAGASAALLSGSRSLGAPAAVPASAGRRSASARGSIVEVWDVASGARVGVREEASGRVTLSPDGHIVAIVGTAAKGGTVVLRDRATWRPIRTVKVAGPGTPVCAVALSLDGKRLAAGTEQAVLAYDVATAKRTWKAAAGERRHLLFSGDGRFVAGWRIEAFMTSRAVTVWDAATGAVVRVFRGEDVPAFSPDGALLATVGCDESRPGGNRWVLVRDTASWQEVRRLPLRDFPEFSPAGGLLAVAPLRDPLRLGPDGKMPVGVNDPFELWNTATWQLAGKFGNGYEDISCGVGMRFNHGVRPLCFSPNGRFVAARHESALNRFTTGIYRVVDGAERPLWPPPGVNSASPAPLFLGFSADAKVCCTSRARGR